MGPKINLLVAAVVGCVSLITAGPSSAVLRMDTQRAISIWNDNGGHMVSYAIKTLKFERSGTSLAFRGRCASACTLYLALPSGQTCLTRGASFRFHAPYGASGHGNAIAATFMLEKYPPWVRSWIQRHGGLSSRALVMNYDYARQYLRTCTS